MSEKKFKPTDEQRQHLQTIITDTGLVDVIAEQFGDFTAHRERQSYLALDQFPPEHRKQLMAEFLQTLTANSITSELQVYLEEQGINLELFYNWLFYSYIGNLEE